MAPGAGASALVIVARFGFRSDGRLEMKYHPLRDGGGYGQKTTEVGPRM
jgi:hypothetical protein